MRIIFNNVMQCIALFEEGYSDGTPADFYNPTAFVENFVSLRPDILCLAEVPFDNEDGKSSFISALSKQLAFPYYHSAVGERSWLLPDKWYGLSILSRWPIEKYHEVALPNPKLSTIWSDGNEAFMHDKHAQSCRIVSPDNEINLVNLHGYPFHKFKRHIREYPVVVKEMENLFKSDGLMVVCGDFNNKRVAIEEIFPETFSSSRLKNIVRFNMNDFFVTETTGQIDHILCSPNFVIERTIVEKGLSDHPILIADLVGQSRSKNAG